jgi:hypothetical protein
MAGEQDKGKAAEQPDKTTIEIEADKPLEPIEITLTDDGGTAAEVKDKGAEPTEKKPKSGRFQARIDKITARAAEAETTAQRLHRENEELKATLKKTNETLEVTDRAAFNNHAENVESRLKQAKADMVAATNAGDADKIADATAEVAKWGAEQARVESWKRSHPEPTKEEREAQRAKDEPKPKADPQKPQQRVTPELQDFLDRSPWFVPNSGEFDQDMHQVARRYAGKLEAKMKQDGREDEIGNSDYYENIEQHMRKVFPDHEWEDGGGEEEPETPKRGLPKMGADQRQVSDRSTSNGTQHQPSANSNKITLNGDQRSFVRSMVDQGAYGKNPKTDKPYTYAEAEVRYAREVLRDKEIQKQKAGG